MDPADVVIMTEWLGGTRGTLVLPAPLQEALLESAERLQMWELADRPEATEKLSDDVVRFFEMLFTEMAEPARGITGVFTGTPFLRFVRWLRAGTLLESAASTPAAGHGEQAVTEECKRDMAAQGATAPEQIRWLSLGMHLGRSVSSDELKGGQHAAPPQMMEGAKMAKKFGVETIDGVLARAKADGSLAPFEVFLARAMSHWASSGHTYAGKASGLLMEWWQTVKRTNDNDVLAILDYIAEYRAFYVGRGLPVMHDAKIQATVSTAMIKRLQNGGVAEGGGSSGGKQTVVDDKTQAMLKLGEAVSAVVEQLKEVSSGMRSQQRQLDSLRGRIDRGGGGDGGEGGGGGGGGDGGAHHTDRKCYHCQKTGHIANNCPEKK
jgi:hypothetical protein